MRRGKCSVLKLFGHVERIGEDRMVKRALMEGNRGRGRPQRRWMDEVKELLTGRGLSEME